MSTIKQIFEQLSEEGIAPGIWSNFLIAKPILDELDWNTLSKTSSIEQQPNRLILFLQHTSDRRTNLKIVIDGYEIIVFIDDLPVYLSGSGAQGPKTDGEALAALTGILKGNYSFIEYLDKFDKSVKRELTFHHSVLADQQYFGVSGNFNFGSKRKRVVCEPLSFVQ